MTSSGVQTRPSPAAADLGSQAFTARMVLDVDYALDGIAAALLRSELRRGGTVQVVLLLPPPSLLSNAIVVLLWERWLVEARERRLAELALVAGPHGDRVTVLVQRRRHRHRRRPRLLAQQLLARIRSSRRTSKGRTS